MPRARFGWTLVAIAVLALCVRLWVAAEFQGLSSPPDAGANPDQVDYEALGWRLASGAGFSRADGSPTAFRPPGTPVLIEVPLVEAPSGQYPSVHFRHAKIANVLFLDGHVEANSQPTRNLPPSWEPPSAATLRDKMFVFDIGATDVLWNGQ